MFTQFNPQATRVAETTSFSTVQKTPVINAHQFASTLAGSGDTSESKGFISKAWYYISYPIVKIGEFVKWILCCCPKSDPSKFESKVDILKILLAADPEAAAKEAAKDPKTFFSNLLDNCLAKPEELGKQLNEGGIDKFINKFSALVPADDPIRAAGNEVMISKEFLAENATLFASAIDGCAKTISTTLGTTKDTDSAPLKDMKVFFETFLPALANAMRANPADYKDMINEYVDASSTGLFSKNSIIVLYNNIPNAKDLAGNVEAHRFAQTLVNRFNMFDALNHDLETGNNTLNLEKPIKEIFKFPDLGTLFHFNLISSYTPAQIDELLKSLNGQPHRMREAIVFDRLKALPGTANRVEALRIYDDIRFMMRM